MATEQDAAQESTSRKIPFKELDVRIFSRNDLPQMPRLMLECLGRHVTESWLDWKFFQSPFGGELGFVVAYHGDDLVAFIGANPVPFAEDGELTLVYQHQDTAIREDCRSLAALKNLTDAAEAATVRGGHDPRVRLTYSITTPHMRALVTKRMKYTIVWERLKMVKLISLRAYVSKATRSAALTAILPGPRTRSWKAPSSMTGDLAPVETFGPDFDLFWQSAKRPGDEIGRIFPWQDSKWLNYKFRQDQQVEFHCFAYREAGQVMGYLVLNITRLDVRIGYIDALWALPGRDDVIDLLTDFALHELTRHKCDQVSVWTRPETPVGQALDQRGFVRRDTPQCFSVKQVWPDMGDIGLKYEHWNLQRGHTYYTSLGHLSTEEGALRLYKAKQARDEARSQALSE